MHVPVAPLPRAACQAQLTVGVRGRSADSEGWVAINFWMPTCVNQTLMCGNSFVLLDSANASTGAPLPVDGGWKSVQLHSKGPIRAALAAAARRARLSEEGPALPACTCSSAAVERLPGPLRR